MGENGMRETPSAAPRKIKDRGKIKDTVTWQKAGPSTPVTTVTCFLDNNLFVSRSYCS